MKRRIAYAGAALTAVLAAVALTAPAASAESDWHVVDPGTSQSGPSTDEIEWG
ncbi:MAG: hypothetical protein ACRDO7_16140 [Nocardioidaceae bacterium]